MKGLLCGDAMISHACTATNDACAAKKKEADYLRATKNGASWTRMVEQSLRGLVIRQWCQSGALMMRNNIFDKVMHSIMRELVDKLCSCRS
ncbi:hypothetical protein [Bradyrhizobium sp. CCBAU 11386]|uniref:hypothetical protein n=1 Tax=Bradyrhizobium sp. CCBAU 11386 TaxID=1630837 RepID=UPI0023026AD3|nr:hypothetical protein [Bradyrhizobium sp. CCBAU 11386]